MTESQAYDIMSEAIWAVILASGPVLAVALLVGLGIAFFQALTQIQEMTLTFVPKIVAIFFVILLSLPFMFATLDRLGETIFDMIRRGGL